jgi:hypothetical protein
MPAHAPARALKNEMFPQVTFSGDRRLPFVELLNMPEGTVPFNDIRRIGRTDGVVVFSSSLHACSPASPAAPHPCDDTSPVAPPATPEADSLPDLPDALWVIIMRFAGTREVCMLARVSKALRRCAFSPAVWRERHEALFGCATPAPAPGASAADAGTVLRRVCRKSDLRAARWLESHIRESTLGGAAVCVALDGAKAACGERDCLRVYGAPGAADAADAGRKLGTLRGHTADITCVAVSDAALLSGDASGQLRLWDAEDFKLRRAFRGHVGEIAACALLPAGGVPISAGADGCVRIWDAAAPQPLAVLQCETAVAALAVDASSGRLYAGGGFIDCYDIATATRVATLVDVLDEPSDGGLVPITRLAAHGPLLAAGGAAGGVSLWDVRAGPRLVGCLPTAGSGACSGLQLDEWKLVAAFGGDESGVCVYDIRSVIGAGACDERVRAPLMRLHTGARVTALGFCGSVLLAAVEGRPCVSWSFDAPSSSRAAAAAGTPLAAATSSSDSQLDGNADAGRGERRKKGVVPKIRGRFPKRGTR